MFKNLLGVLASTRSNSQWFLEEAREQTVQRACASRVAAPLSKRSLIPPWPRRAYTVLKPFFIRCGVPKDHDQLSSLRNARK